MKTKITLLLTVLVLSISASAASYSIPGTGTQAWSGMTTSFWSNFQDYDELFIPAGRTFKIDDAACNELEGLDIIIRVEGTLGFATNGSSYANLFLSSGSSIILQSNGTVTNYGNCDNHKAIYFGGSIVATCDGSSNSSSTAYYTFSDINTAGGIGAAGPVPVKWVNFDAVAAGKDVQISWSTASEKDNSHFEIEFSTDATNWVMVDQLQSKSVNGNSNELLQYSAVHHVSEEIAQVYYRIKQVDFNGDMEYTDVITVKMENAPSVIFETKGSGKATIKSIAKGNSEVTVRIIDLAGTLVGEYNFDNSVDVQVHTAGIYVFEFNRKGETKVEKHFIY